MTRIPEHIIDQVRQAADLVEVVGRTVRLEKRGRRFWGKCPFHGDSDPSLSVDPAAQRWHCFGCGASGDVFGWVCRETGADFPTAVRQLAAGLGIAIPEARRSADEQKADDHAERLRAVCAHAAEFYAGQLAAPQGEPGLAYLQGRGFSAEDAALWGLGWAPDDWSALRGHLAQRGVAEADGLAAGLLAKSKGRVYDRFRGRVIIPIRDRAGRVVSLAGRIVGEGEPKYLNGPETPIFAKSRLLFNWPSARRAIAQRERAVVVEGQFDALSLAAAGIAETVAPMGTAISEHHAKDLAKLTRNVILALDGDEAGWKAARRSLGPMLAAGLFPRVAAMPGGRDPDETVRQLGPTAFGELLAQAKPLLQAVLDDLRGGFDMASVEGQAHYLDEVKPILDQEPDRIIATGYIKALAKELDLPKSEVAKRLSWQKNPAATRRPAPSQAVDEAETGRQEMLDAANALAQYREYSEFDKTVAYRPLLLVKDILREHKILHHKKTGLVYAWNGQFWAPAHHEAIKQLVIGKMGLAASRNRVGEAVELILALTALPGGEEMDQAPELICCQNGMLDLDSGDLRPHDPALRCTIHFPYDWRPDDPPRCPWFKRTLRECLDDPEVIDEVLEFLGYLLWCRQSFKKALLLVGPKDCGKSMIQEVMRQMLGPDNCSAVDMADLEDQFQRVALHRKLANICGEVSANFYSSKAFMRLTGGDPLQAAYKGVDTFTFNSAAKLIFSSNEFPRVRETSDAFYERMLAVRFPRQFKLGQPGTDTHRLEQIVPGELPGIFHLAVARLYYLRKRGAFGQSAASRAFLNQYRLENDHVAQFLAECCATRHEDGTTPEGAKAAVYNAYKKWCEENGIGRPKASNKFWSDVRQAHPQVKLADHGPKRPDGSRPPYVYGLHLIETISPNMFAA